MANLNRYGKNAWKVNALNWAVRLVVLGIIAGAGFFGYTKLKPVISEKIEELKAKAVSQDEEGESEEENNGIGKVLPEDVPPQPVYQWDFNVGMEELVSGISCTPYGDAQIVSIDDPNAPVSNALYLDGDGDYIDCGREIQFDHDFTLNVLVNCADVYKDYTAIIGKFEENGPLVLSFRQGHVNCWIISDTMRGDVETDYEVSADTWHNITVVYEAGELRLYVDAGIAVQETVGQLTTNEELVTIGRQADMFDPENHQYKGYIGNITIYDGAMTPEEIGCLTVENLEPRQEEISQMLMTVTADSLNVRSEPSTDGSIVTTLQSGEKVELLDDPGNGWVNIRCIERNNEEGYVSSNYLSPEE